MGNLLRSHFKTPDDSVATIPASRHLGVSFAQLQEQAVEHTRLGHQIVVVQGLGFVGTAVAAAISAATDAASSPRFFVIGVDLCSERNRPRIEAFNRGESPIRSPDPDLSRLIRESVLLRRNLCATSVEEAYTLADVIVVDVQLDVKDRTAKSSSKIEIVRKTYEAALRTIGERMKPDALVVIETTVPMGTTEKIVRPILEKARKARGFTQPLLLAHAYERVMPGPNYVKSIRQFWRTFSGVDALSARKAREFLESFIDTKNHPLTELSNPTSSELAKLLENSYRAANIAFIHEWTLLAEQIGVNLFEVIRSIRVRKGTHDNIREPGFGVGGYCLTKDSLLAQWGATHLFKTKAVLDTTLRALKMNYGMPLHTLSLLKELFPKGLRRKTIGVCGISYLPELDDTRNSPSELFVDALKKEGAIVLAHDPFVTEWRERPKVERCSELTELIRACDGIVFTTPHQAYLQLSTETLIQNRHTPLAIVDAQNIISDEKAAACHQAGHCILGVGKGHWRVLNYHRKLTSHHS